MINSKMKKIALFATILATLFTSCEIDREPYDKYTEEQVKSDLTLLLNGSYSALKGYWGDNMHYAGEFCGDNVMKQAPSSDAWFEFISYKHTTTNYRMKNFWVYSYKIISQTSDMFKTIEAGQSAEIDSKLGEGYFLRGMMYFYLCRTFGRPYYQDPDKNLGVPIVNGMPEDIINMELPDRATVKETYQQAISDLKKAEEMIGENKGAAYASKEAAQALLSRIYLYMSGTYENPNQTYADSAIYYAKKVIDSGHYTLLDRAKFMKFNEMAPDDASQTETIFAVKRVSSEFSTDDYYSCIGGMYSTIDGIGWGEVYASAEYLDLLRESKGTNDARWAFIRQNYASDNDAFRFVAKVYKDGTQTGYTYYQGLTSEKGGKLYVTLKEEEYPLTLVDAETNSYSISYEGETYVGERGKEMVLSNGYPQYFIIKCSLQEGETQLHSPIVARLSEMYLNLAEAYAKKGDYANALTNLNIVRERSIVGGAYKSLNASDAAQLINKERRLELAFEGQRGPDVFRIGETMRRHYPGIHDNMSEFAATDNKVVMYIPQDEINAWPGTLTQNP